MTYHYQTPIGVAINEQGYPEPLAAGWTEIDEGAYNGLLLAIILANKAEDDAANNAVCQLRKDACDALVGLGLPDATAHLLSGYKHGDC